MPCKTIDFGGITSPDIDNTDLNSTAMTTRPGVPDYGTISATVNFVPSATTIADIRSMLDGQLISTWQVQYQDGSTVAIDATSTGTKETTFGYVNSFNPTGFSFNGLVTANITVKRTSKPTIGAAT